MLVQQSRTSQVSCHHLEMVLQAQELAPSGIMLVILSQKYNIYKAKQSKDLKIWHLKGSGQDLKSTLKLKYSPVTYLCSLFCTLTCTIIVSKAWG